MTERRIGEQDVSRGQPMDEVEFDRVKGDRGDAGFRGQPMDEVEFD